MNRTILPSLATALLLSGVWPAAPSRAATELDELPNPALYIGLFGGGNLVLGDWDLNVNPDEGTAPDSSPIFGLRLGVQATRWLAAELGAGFIPYSADGDRGGLAAVYRADILLHPLQTRWSPYLVLGGGLYQNASGDLGDDADWDIHWGLGARGMVADWIALRAEVRHNLTDSFGDGLASLLELTVGVDLFVWRADSGPPLDTDGDGIADTDDVCRTVAGSVTAAGCPDADNDGVEDGVDSCPDKPGPKANGGCPDSDGDGLPDDLDRCPEEAGPPPNDGCPLPAADSDGDGVPDADDFCPDEPGAPDSAGCPDSDNDGILDRDDRCPHQAGVVSEQGCLPKAITERFSGAIKGIYFETGSAEIRKKSYAILTDAALVLLEYPTVEVEIQGHTDDKGEAADNLALSQARAEAVRAFLIAQGVEADRLVAKGYGETTPIASNKTRKGRATNRRIEFKMISQ